MKLDQKKYDVNTITASDFTVEFDITKEMWDYYLETYYKDNGENQIEESGQKYSPALFLKKHLTDNVSKILTESL